MMDQLYNGMTELQHISLYYPKGVKIKKRLNYKKLNQIELVNHREWLFDKTTENIYFESIENIDNLYNYDKVVRNIDSLSPLNKRILRYMFNNQFVKINSKQKVAKFIGVSEETIRKRLIEIRKHFRPLKIS
jgi:DNA-binding protein Fis